MLSIFIKLALLIGVAIASQKSYDGYKVYSVKSANERDLEMLNAFEGTNGVDFWDPINRKNENIRVMVEPAFQQLFETSLVMFNIEHEVIIENAEVVFAKEREQQRLHKLQGRSTIDFEHFWTLAEINDYLDQLADTYPSFVTVEVIGTSYEGRPIRAVRISLNDTVGDARPTVVADGTLHAREWIGTMVSLHLIHELVEHSDLYTHILNEVDVVLVPVLNVDGYSYSHTNDRMWRKTRSPNAGSTCIGTDPNRNFDYQWNAPGGASTNPCSESFRGSAPFSESEVLALGNLMTSFSNLKLYMAIHSYGNYVLYPYGYAFPSIARPNSEELHEVGLKYAEAVYAVNGTRYTVGNSADVLYIASGASDDYAAGAGNAVLAYTLELPGGGNQGFDIPAYRIPSVLAETFPGIYALLSYAALGYPVPADSNTGL